MDIHKLYVSKHDPKLPKSFVSTSTRGVLGDVEVVLTFYISQTGKTVWGELKVYYGYITIAKCNVKRAVRSYLDDTIRKASGNLLEIAGFSEVTYDTLSQIDYRQARELVQELLQQLTDANPDLTVVKVTRDWRLA